ncbi:MAG: peptidase domain-containing ABC transporter [Rivularia sp. (in: Bacteria)]|nr:peptidase domain-containing ABC transporter [Rivularia sp. MS3]
MDSYPRLGVQKSDNDTKNIPSSAASKAIYQLWKQVVEDTNCPSEFQEAWIAREFELGDEVTKYYCADDLPAEGGAVYLLIKGQIRLLAFDASLEKEVSIQLLHPNQVFGGDNIFCTHYQEYRAIASTPGVLFQISVEKLDVWLQRYPALSDYFSQKSQSLQKLIFFKTLTEFRSQNTFNLQKILPYFASTEIDAGCSLMASSFCDGYFWLVSGEIDSISEKNRPPKVGETWGHPQRMQSNFVSRTNLSLFYLPKQYVDSVKTIVSDFKTADNGLDIQENDEIESKSIQPKIPKCGDDTFALTNQHPPRSWFQIYPFIQQQSSSDCGAATLAMISKYWGKRFSINSLRSIAHINSMGAELNDLANAAECLGYQALAVRGSLNQLKLQTLPWIAHYQGNHYIVVWQIKEKSVLVSDPAIGKKWVSYKEFEASFTGYAVLLSPTEIFFNNKNEILSFQRYYDFFRNNLFLLAIITVISIFLPFLSIVPAVLAQTVIDAFIAGSSLDSINIFALCFLVFGFGSTAFKALRQYFLDYLSNRLDLTLTSDFIARILELPLSFFVSRRIGDILCQIQENPKIHRFLTRQAITTILDGLMTAVYFGLMAYYSWQLTSIVVSFILATIFVLVFSSLFLKKIEHQYSFDLKTQNSAMVEIITGITTIKTENAEHSLYARWQKYFHRTIETRQQGRNLTNFSQFASSLIHYLGSAIVLWWGIKMTINSQISLGEFIAFTMLIGNTVNPILALVKLRDEFSEIVTSIEKLDNVLATNQAPEKQTASAVLPAIRGEVYFENVSFNELATGKLDSQAENILQNVSFSVKAGQTIGIVGRNASANSTIVKLLAGLCCPDSGRILIDGHDIHKVSPHSLSRQLAVIPQDFFLFSGSILENITLYNREYSLEQVQAAAKIAGVHAFIESLPLGYSTVVGEGGTILPRLQLQKIAIARAFVKNPRILIFDETNNCVDAPWGYQFRQNLARLNSALINTSEGLRTTFILTRNVNSIKNADTIIVLDESILADQGTHEELMARNTIYSSLIQQQLDM